MPPPIIRTIIGSLNDRRITKCDNGQYVADGVAGTFRTWLDAHDALMTVLRARAQTAR